MSLASRRSLLATLATTRLHPMLLALVPLPLSGAACSDRLLRESVLASTQSTVGVSLGQNPRTGLYEGTLGYARGELFLVPTGKRVVNAAGEAASADPDAATAMTSAQADTTPEVLGEIMADGAFPLDAGGPPVRVGVYQRLAVGRLAVTTPAAIALMARNSPPIDGTQARETERALDDLASQSAGVLFAVADGAAARVNRPWTAAADAWSRELGFAGYDALYATGSPAVQRALAARWNAELNLARLLAHAARHEPAPAAPSAPAR